MEKYAELSVRAGLLQLWHHKASEVNKMAPIVLWARRGPGDRLRNPVDGPRPYLWLHAAIFSIVKATAVAKLHTWTQILPSAQGKQLHPKSVGVECVSKSDIWQ